MDAEAWIWRTARLLFAFAIIAGSAVICGSLAESGALTRGQFVGIIVVVGGLLGCYLVAREENAELRGSRKDAEASEKSPG